MEVQMRMKPLLIATSTAAMLFAGAYAAAQQPGTKPAPGREGMPMEHQGMMGGGGMMGGEMMNMMQHCERMMGSRGGHAMPQLPPGNEKLQLQMHAEVMQKVGEILGKYAAQLK
jgi:hypothetical protein